MTRVRRAETGTGQSPGISVYLTVLALFQNRDALSQVILERQEILILSNP